MDLDYRLMQELTEIEMNLKELEARYCKKYFRKEIIRPWSFKCHHCSEKVISNTAEEYWIVPTIWKEPETFGRRFCTKDCADVYFNEERNALLARHKRIIGDRELLRGLYEEAEQKFLEIRKK